MTFKKKIRVLLVLHGLQLRLTFHLIQQSISVILLNMDHEAKELF